MTSRRAERRLSLFVEGLVLVHEHFSGIGQYTHGLLTGFDDVLDAGHPQADVSVLLPSRGARPAQRYRHVRSRTVPLSGRTLERLGYRGLVPPLDLLGGRGFYVFPHFVRMPLWRSPSAIVVHDLCYLKHPEFMEPRYARFLARRVAASIRKAQFVVTPTAAIRRDVLDAYDIDPARVVVGSEAVDMRHMHRRSDEEVAAARAAYGIPDGEYLLFLGNLEPRKNVGALLSAYEALDAALRSRVSLLLVSAGGWRNAELSQRVDALRRRGYAVVRPTRVVSDTDKPAIISGATALVFPSFYEGFGLPVLEALACGVPVVTSDDPALLEVTGDAAMHVPPHDSDALREAIVRCITDAESLRAAAATSGPQRATAFSWARTAEAYLELGSRLSG